VVVFGIGFVFVGYFGSVDLVEVVDGYCVGFCFFGCVGVLVEFCVMFVVVVIVVDFDECVE